MTQLIPQLLGRENFPFPPTIERAHRSPTTTPQSGFAGARGDGSKPRPMLIKLLNFQDKVKILRLAKDKKLMFKDKQIHIFPDFSAELTRKRRSFDAVKRKLRDLNMKYSLRYPCTLSVMVDGKSQRFTCHKAAESAFFTSPINSPMQN
ncbi:hypothetical protein WMY93_012255 [Mugilogobius chulae]|uniref:Uncharacterized protein n=1 Tax=Mugilogobius chulae TaxID=88201 RepID=A0AAW0PDR4_9GOBI